MKRSKPRPASPTAPNLIAAVDAKVEQVRTRTLDISFNELLDMYTGNELIIQPEYQRLFRWPETKQSQFIESLVLELPIPPIFVIETTDNYYELIDGLQRVSTYMHFRGALKDRRSALELTGCDVVRDLNGLTYDNLPNAIKIKLKRSFVRMEVIRKESDPRLRYYMFKRLNTGGEILSQQEIRNCTIRLLSSSFNDFITELSQNADFRTCITPLSEEKVDRKEDQELVLRFFAFKNYRHEYEHTVGDFMTSYMEYVSDPANTEVTFDYETERAVFESTFRLLNRTLVSEE